MVFNEALITAIARDEVESVQILLDQGANINFGRRHVRKEYTKVGDSKYL